MPLLLYLWIMDHGIEAERLLHKELLLRSHRTNGPGHQHTNLIEKKCTAAKKRNVGLGLERAII